MKRIRFVHILTMLLWFLNGCDREDHPVVQPFGQVTFSFQRSVTDPSDGRQRDQATPDFVSYTIKKADGSLISNKIALYEFNGSFVTMAEQLQTGHYTLEQFMILDSDDHTIYASPVAGSELADLVEHPLPLPFDISSEEVTSVVPEVLALANHTPEQFGYVAFGFEVINKFDFDITATIADDAQHLSVNYTLEIIAKDAALGNVKWTKVMSMASSGVIHIPAKYAHYTFKAIKPGYIPHVQHFLKGDLSQYHQLSFEFLPESLEGFMVAADGQIKFYTSKDRCRFYARLDMPEGYKIPYGWVDRSASSPSGFPLDGGMKYRECGMIQYGIEPFCGNNVNLFDNTPFALALDHCALVDLALSETVHSMEDVFFRSSLSLNCVKPGAVSDTFIEFYTWWHEGNSENQ